MRYLAAMMRATRPIGLFVPMLVSFAFAALPLAAQSAKTSRLDDILPAIGAENRSTLLDEGVLLRFHPDGVTPSLLPENDLTAGIIRRVVTADLNIGIEGLFFTPQEELPPAYGTMDTAQRHLELYNILRSVSTLEGLEYFSASRGEMRLLFEESWAIPDPDSADVVLPDPLVTAVPEEDTIFLHQKDKSFANNESVMRFTARPEVIAASIVNLTPMRYKGLIRVVDPENMQIHLVVVPLDEGLLMYGTMSARTRDVKAFMDRARNSFTNRVIALTWWYRDRLIEEFR